MAPPRVNAASAPSAAAIAGVPWCHHIRPGPCGAKNLDLRKEQRWANWQDSWTKNYLLGLYNPNYILKPS